MDIIKFVYFTLYRKDLSAKLRIHYSHFTGIAYILPVFKRFRLGGTGRKQYKAQSASKNCGRV